MKRLLQGSTVASRVTLLAAGILILLLVTFTIIDYQVQRRRVIDELEGYSEQFSRAVEGSLAMGMIAMRRDLVHPMRKLERLASDIAEGSFPTEIKPELRGDVARLGDVLIDMSKRLEESFRELKSAHDYMNRLVDSIEDGLLVIDADFRVTNVNPSALNLAGRERGEIISQNCREICLFRGKTEICPAHQVLVEKRPCTEEVQLQNDDGRTRLFEIQASPLFGADGEVKEVVEVIRDITSRRELERSLAHSDRLSAVGRLAASIAHEINTPLGTILTCVEGLLRDLNRSPQMQVSDWNDLEPYLQSSLGAVWRCRKIVEELLLYVRRDETPVIEDVDMNNVIHDAIDMVRHEPHADQVDFTVELEDTLSPIRGDHTQLTQVVFNLLQNSVDALENGGRTAVRSSRVDGGVQVTIEDDGIGIPPENHARIFEPFFTTKEVGEGTGLGLYLCREIVKRHGGTVSWESLSKGTLFRIRLPVASRLPDA